MREFLKKNIGIIGFCLFAFLFVLLNILNSGNFFTWDTIQLGSKHAHWYYGNNFRDILLPDSMDSGHIPFFGFYLALSWKLFGKTLLVSHLSILPFTLGIIWQTLILVKKYFPWYYILPAMAIILLDPTLLTQSTLVSPDILLVFFFLLGLLSIISL